MQTWNRPDASTDETDRWRAVLHKDGRFDGAFVYAVRSTGIYCRPSCPSRRPRREHVVFFALPEAAERAGFRACRRCRPREQAPQLEMVRRACRYIESHMDGPLTLAALSEAAGVSPHHLQRTFRRLVGISPRQYADALRLDLVKAQLRQGQGVTAALYDAGYGSSSRLYERAPAQLGMTPGTYRRGGRGMRLRYAIVDCALGRLQVAATERGICAVSLGNSDAELEAGLCHEYPQAEILRDQAGLEPWTSALLRHLEGQLPCLDLPLDVRATAFQRRVWEELRAIPYGSSRSYGEIAKAVGRPRAARAVARACATNPAALLIPCHRVVSENGSLGGYRWGAERKQHLLEEEHAQSKRAKKGSC